MAVLVGRRHGPIWFHTRLDQCEPTKGGRDEPERRKRERERKREEEREEERGGSVGEAVGGSPTGRHGHRVA